MFTVNKKLILKQFSIVSLILVCASFYTQYEADAEEATQTIGVLCCAVTVVFFAAPFTMLQHVFRVKNCESLPFPLILATFIVSLEWFVYGVMIDDTFIQVISIWWLMIANFIDFVLFVCLQIPNVLGCILAGSQLSLFIFYPNKPQYGGPVYRLLDQAAV